MATSYERLKTRLEAYEVEATELREGIAKAVSDGTLHPSAAGAELIARAIRGGATSYTKALKSDGVDLPGGFGGENLGDRQSVQELQRNRVRRDGNPFNLG